MHMNTREISHQRFFFFGGGGGGGGGGGFEGGHRYSYTQYYNYTAYPITKHNISMRERDTMYLHFTCE